MPRASTPTPASAATDGGVTEQATSTPDPHCADDQASSRGRSAELARMEDTLRDRTRLIAAQRKDEALQPLRAQLEAGRGEDNDYNLDDQQLLWHVPRG